MPERRSLSQKKQNPMRKRQNPKAEKPKKRKELKPQRGISLKVGRMKMPIKRKSQRLSLSATLKIPRCPVRASLREGRADNKTAVTTAMTADSRLPSGPLSR